MKLAFKRAYYVVTGALILTWGDLRDVVLQMAKALLNFVLGVILIVLTPALLLDNGRKTWRTRRMVTEKTGWRF